VGSDWVDIRCYVTMLVTILVIGRAMNDAAPCQHLHKQDLASGPHSSSALARLLRCCVE
jgi:hypothetical protein